MTNEEKIAYFRKNRQLRDGLYNKSYNKYRKNILKMNQGGQECGMVQMADGKFVKKCKKVFRSVGDWVTDKGGWKSLAATAGLGLLGGLTYNKAKKDKNWGGGFGDFLRGIGQQ